MKTSIGIPVEAFLFTDYFHELRSMQGRHIYHTIQPYFFPSK